MKITKDKISEWVGSGIVGGLALTIVMSFVTVVTGSWAVVEPFVRAHLGESAACTSVVLGFGAFLGALINRHATRKHLAAKDKEIAELEKRPTQVEVDTAIAEKDARLAELGVELEKAKKEDEPPILTCDQALNFVQSLTDNQHAILKEMYENGGTLEADPLDGDLLSLAEYRIIERPSMFVPGIDAKWTLSPNINAIIRRHPEVLLTEAEKREIEKRKHEHETEDTLDKFSNAQLDLMVRIADACDEFGSLRLPLMSQDHLIGMQLVDIHVATFEGNGKNGYEWHLLPDWRKFATRHRAAIDERTKDIREKREKDIQETATQEALRRLINDPSSLTGRLDSIEACDALIEFINHGGTIARKDASAIESGIGELCGMGIIGVMGHGEQVKQEVYSLHPAIIKHFTQRDNLYEVEELRAMLIEAETL